MKWRAFLVACAAATALAGAAPGQSRKPKLPPGADPGGVAIALASGGIDYTRPDIALALARDGEGDLIGWDTIDRDNRPYAAGDDGAAIARAMLGADKRRLVPIRIDPARPPTITEAIAFAARTPSQMLVIALGVEAPAAWHALVAAAASHPRLLIVVAAPHPPLRSEGRAAAPSNVLVVAALDHADVDVVIAGTPPPSLPTEAGLVAALLQAPGRCMRARPDGRPAANRRYDRLLALLPGTPATPASATPSCLVRPRG